MTECFVGIDTSNYTTSAAICTKDGEIVANLKLPLPVKAGECVEKREPSYTVGGNAN